MIVGYTTGVFDLLHVGHINLLKNAKALCDVLIVGVTTDELVQYKGTKSLLSFEERIRIVEGIKYVDVVIPQATIDKVEAWRKLKFDVLFVGDDWYEQPSWMDYEANLKENGARIVYFPYTKGISTTDLKKRLSTYEV
ncbi:MAG TPA: adenylyltransferase/cytidyltransferase family protein [Aequorivita sp.]|nr:adenylyltransferase/cytidyltransferase family protein [Aequorivita sp.]